MATRIEFRFIFDSHFFEEIIKEDFDLQEKLSYITSKASGNKKRQNIISAKTRKKICDDFSINETTIRIFLNKIEEPETIEIEEDEIIRTLRYAVHLTYQWPHKVIIFTSESKIKDYNKCDHYGDIKSISFKSGENAKELIDYWFKKCRDERSSSCD